jgi:cobalt/nickel transport system permease protein
VNAARLRILACLLFIAAALSLRSLPALGLATAVAAAALAACCRSAWAPLRRILLVLPFGGLFCLGALFWTPGTPAGVIDLGPLRLVVSQAGCVRAAAMALRLSASACALGALAAATPPLALFGALPGLGVPRFFAQLCLFLVRYADVLAGEVARMVLAGRARCFVAARYVLRRDALRRTGHLAGALLDRASGRAERVYLAMLARGLGGAGVRVARPVAGPGRGWGLLSADGLVLLAAIVGGAALVMLDRGWATAAASYLGWVM